MADDYVDFDVALEREGEGGTYAVHVAGAGERSASAVFTLPFAPTELAEFMVAVGPPRVASRRLVPAVERVTDVKEYGTRLGEALFAGEVGTAFTTVLDAARREGRDVRLRLRLDAVPELESVPWEYLYSERLGRFVTLSTRTPVVRLLDALDPPPPVTVQAPLRVLVLISSPTDVPELAVDREEQLLRATTSDLVAAGQVELAVLERPTLAALQRALLEPYHVFHFIGHGGFDRAEDEGVLVLEREDGTAHRVSGARLGTLLHDARDLQLAVLNACEGARTSGRDAFSGVGQALVRQGLPAVVAMQTEISDRAALVFSHEFYWFLTRGLGVDAAICEVRKAMATSDEASEWGTAVLLRSGGAQPFSFAPAGVAAPVPETRWRSLYDAAQDALAADESATALPLLEQLAAERPDFADVTDLLERVRPSGLPWPGESAPAGPADSASPVRPLSPPRTPPSEPTGSSPPPAPGSPAPSRRVLVGAAVGVLVAGAAVGVALWRASMPPGRATSAQSTSTAVSGTTPSTAAGVPTVDLPTTGVPTGALVLPYAVDGDFHSGAGSNQVGADGDVVDVLRLPGGNRVVTVVQSGRLRFGLEDLGGATVADLGEASHVEANRGTRFAFVDGAGRLTVRDDAGQEVAALPDVGRDARVVGFAGRAVFFTRDGSTFRWDTSTARASEWRQSEMVVFNDSTRTAVGMSSSGCFAVLKVDTPSQVTRPLDCHGLPVTGVTGDGRYAIVVGRATGSEPTQVLLVDTRTGRAAFVVRVPSGSIVVQAGYRTSPTPRTLVLSTVTPDGRNRLVGCPTDGACAILTEPIPTSGDPAAPPPYVIARD
jgi:hypothetical protein